ncbi:two-component system sporulation sensor kinase A [Aneurinibacillus soli]|uniref:histidine kinase n=3 Tax=Aneurinibacillus soli TaxID=1500254 RepID=A0A0U5C6M4_9BACL|nr:two-component system sporulation sensor kinase A [Aneurinibacillus soli]BAU27779.1 Sporulation kinase D [Aneurinibacillus soli]
MITLYECKESLLPLIIKKIPIMIQAHLQDMIKEIENFHEVIEDIEAYRISLYSVCTTVVGTLFKENDEYVKALQQIEQAGYEIGVYFGEVRQISRETLIQITHNIRVNSFEHVCYVMNHHLSDPKERTFLIARFNEILNTRFTSCINGFLFAKDKVINHLHNQKLSIMGQMAAGMAHEIRNPLCSIKGFQQLMKQLLLNETEDRKDFLNYIDICIDEISQVENLVSDFLILARKGESQKSKWEKVNLNHVIQKVHDLSTYFAVEKNVTIHLYMPKASVFVQGVSSHIEQIVLNIIKNGISALKPEGILFITLDHSMDNKEAVLTFVDNGIGIPESQLSKIFDPFFTTKEEGTGLGLCICKGLVEEMKGSITIQSKEKEGTTVEIRVPLVTVCSK